MLTLGRIVCVEEIIDAGLAVVTAKARNRLQQDKTNKKMTAKGTTRHGGTGGSDDREEDDVQKSDIHEQSTPTATGTDATPTNMEEKIDEDDDDDKDDGGYEVQYSDLMDRFRGRLMVPIFDGSGKHVVGFGGRHLDIPPKTTTASTTTKKGPKTTMIKSNTQAKDDSTVTTNVTTNTNNTNTSTNNPTETNANIFQPPKYLNTPETPVFLKRHLLFNLHSAATQKSLLLDQTPSEEDLNPDGPTHFASTVSSIVIVEGYFDAVALYGAGVKEVTSCMGSAISREQLEAAAGVVGSGGRIILCLDADEAGTNAMERVCSSTMIWTILQKTGVDIFVATLPDGLKDPADFIEAKTTKNGSGDGGDAFRKEVMEEAASWSDWFISRIIARYEVEESEEGDGDGMGSSFLDVCDKVTSFLSSFPNPVDRTRRAYQAASILADCITTKK